MEGKAQSYFKKQGRRRGMSTLGCVDHNLVGTPAWVRVGPLVVIKLPNGNNPKKDSVVFLFEHRLQAIIG